MTALDYANDRENVVVRFAGNGCPGGVDIALLPDTELPFDLADVEGEVGADGGFTATNLSRGYGEGWRFTDWRQNTIYAIWLRADPEVWQAQYDDYMSAT